MPTRPVPFRGHLSIEASARIAHRLGRTAWRRPERPAQKREPLSPLLAALDLQPLQLTFSVSDESFSQLPPEAKPVFMACMAKEAKLRGYVVNYWRDADATVFQFRRVTWQ